MAAEPLDLHKHFPPIHDADWEHLVPDSLNWHPLEGFVMRPFYRKTDRSYAPAYAHSGWRLRLNGRASDIAALLKRGATAIGIEDASVLKTSQLSELLQWLKNTDIPCFFECGDDAMKVMERLRATALAADLRPSTLRGAVSLDATAAHSSLAALASAADGTRCRTVRINLMPLHRAGANCVQELAAAISQLAYCLANLGAEIAAERLYFSVPVGTRYLLHIARLRALRHLTDQVYEAFGVRRHNAPVEGVPSPRHRNSLDPDTHLVRITLQYMAAAVGGCNVIAADGLTESRISLILQHEADIAHTIDPSAGAWYIEALTDRLAESAWELFQQMEALGGFFKAQEWLQEQIRQTAQEHAQLVRCGKQPLVSVNCYSDLSYQVPLEANSCGQLAEPFEQLRRRVQRLDTPPAICVLQGPEKAHSWIHQVLRCAGMTAKDTCDRADIVVAFSTAQATNASAYAPSVLVLEQLPTRRPDVPVLTVGEDMVSAAELILEIIIR